MGPALDQTEEPGFCRVPSPSGEHRFCMLELIFMMIALSKIPGARGSAFPTAVSPMLLHSEKKPFNKEGWLYEPKLDGMRAIALVNNGKCKLISRNGRDITGTFLVIAEDLQQRKGQFVLDGEIVAAGKDGRPDFEALQARWLLSKPYQVDQAEKIAPASFYTFDLLYAKGLSLSSCKLVQRKSMLQSSIENSSRVKVIEGFEDGIALYEACHDQDLEGIVCKREASLYQEGLRSRDWIKIKFTQTNDFLVIGWKKDEGFIVSRTGDPSFKPVGVVQYGFTHKDYQTLLSILRPKDKDERREHLWFEPEVTVRVESCAGPTPGN